ncbi:MAG TPA: hypothetical protein VNM14_04945 [Planctomycetota bacterium]|nr:hypothetical protein [Planctomycetota bacterium]
MLFATIILGLFLPATAASAEQDLQVSGSAGWGGRALRGEYAPVLLDVDNRGKKDADLTIAVIWASSFATQPSESPSYQSISGRVGPAHLISLSLPKNSRKRLSLSLMTPDSAQISVWAFALDDKGRTVARAELTTRLLDPHKQIVAVVGTTRPEGIEEAGLELANIQADELPEEWSAYSALEALIWMDGRANEMRSNAQIEALRQWISAGGTFCVARANTLNLDSRITELLPVTLGSTRELQSLGGARFPSGSVVVLESAVRRGAIRAEASGVPLVVEASRDAGRVTFAAFNPSNAPFQGFSGNAELWTWLLNITPAPKPNPNVVVERPPRAIGSLALAHQIRRFPDIAAPEIGGLFLLIILYLIVVGPLDFLLLRWLRKLEYTWFTFPAYVVIFTLFILLVGGAFIQRAAHQRELAIVDHYAESGFTRQRALGAVLAPADVIYKVEDAEPLSSNFIENDRVTDSSGKTSDVRIVRTPQRVAENWLLNRNYTGLAMVDRCSSGPTPLAYTITSQNGASVGLTVKNGSGEAFENAWLVTSRGVYTIPSIPVGDSTLTAPRTFATVQEFARKEGQKAPGQDLDQFGNPIYRYGGSGLTEKELNPQAMKTLVGLSFPKAFEKAETDEPLTGLSRSLQAQPWLDSGGSILLAWPRKAEAVVRFDPKPGRHTSVTLYRFFQGPPP